MTFNLSLVDATAIGPVKMLSEAARTPNSSASMSVHEMRNYCLPESARGKQSSGQVFRRHSSAQGRRRELEWRRTHQEELQQYAGQYVILEGETIIAHGQEPVEIIAKARAQGVRVPYIFFVDDALEGTSQMGL